MWHTFLTGRAAGCGNGSPMVSLWFCNNLRLIYFVQRSLQLFLREKSMISGYILNYEGTQTSKSLHWPMSDLTEQVTCWGNTFFFFLIKPGHSNAYLLTKQGATQLDFHKRAASLKNLCLCSERDGSKAKGWMKPKWFKPSYLASYTWQQH